MLFTTFVDGESIVIGDAQVLPSTDSLRIAELRKLTEET